MVLAGGAAIHNANGRVKSIRLIETAASQGWRIGEPDGRPTASRFVVRDRLEGGFVVWRHHPRCLW
jgi:hypothetical protein